MASLTSTPTPPPCQITIDAETFTLSTPPPNASKQVQKARMHLQTTLDQASLPEDLTRITTLLSLSHTAAIAAKIPTLALHISSLSKKVSTLFTSTKTSLHQVSTSAHSVLTAIPSTSSLLSTALPTALHNLTTNDALAHTLALAAANLSHALSNAADDATHALETAQAHQASRQSHHLALHARITELSVRRARAWETHAMLLESLSEAGRLYTRATRHETIATRRANIFSALSFVECLDKYISSRFGLPWLKPMVSFLSSVRKEAAQAKEERCALLDAKKHQRNLNRAALEDITECSRRIREVKDDDDAVLAAVEALHAAAKELKRLSVVVMRVSAFWSQLGANMGQLSSAELVRIIRATTPPDMGVSGNEDSSCNVGGLCGSSSAKEVGDTNPTAEGNDDDGEDNFINMSVKHEPWVPCAAVQRKMVTYYSRWVALADVSEECLKDIVAAEAQAVKTIELQEKVSSMTPENARDEVVRMATELRREMDAINAELAQYRPSHGEDNSGSTS